ncbi:winged helix-turn-helix domain-containing protein, partial [Myxococcota bacterium]|nr:winged helix-turn-helix domain-containing protein [Myxococcota bacterium]
MLNQTARYRFGAFEVDSKRRELRRGPQSVDVQPKVLDVIVHLIEARDRVVSRDELLDHLWGDAAVSEGVLTTAIHAARTALDDSAARAWAIKTVARRGYRFVAPVAEGDPQHSESISSTPASEAWSLEGVDDFVGGEASLKRVTHAFKRATQGEGGILVVTGEAGQGKTRLLDEVQRQAQSWQALVAATSCEGREGAAAYSPWASLIRKLAF